MVSARRLVRRWDFRIFSPAFSPNAGVGRRVYDPMSAAAVGAGYIGRRSASVRRDSVCSLCISFF